jgi:tetratricopeptide (TPR) repeat protein
MAQSSSRQTAERILTEAWQALDRAPEAARLAAETVLKTAPADAEARLLLAAVDRRGGNAVAAHRRLGPLMTHRTASPIAWFEWGLILAETGDDEGAVQALRRASALAPGFTGAWRALGDQLVALGRAEEAGPAYASAARASTKDPGLAAAAAALAEGHAEQAENLLSAQLQRAPGDLHAAWLLAEAAMRIGRVVEAEAVLTHCLAQAPGFAEARHALAMLLYLQHRFAAAAGHMRILLDQLPHQPGLRILLATCLRNIGDHQAALQLYEQMLAACPTRPSILLAYGHSLKALGREQEAAQAYRTCLPLAPQWAPSLYLSLADLKTLTLTDADLAAMRQPAATVSDFGLAQLGYAIGHALDQRGDYAGAFAAFADGASLRRRAIGYAADDTSAFVEAAKAVFTPAFFAARAGSGCPSASPILIVGLPRAGSTLVEQILASHSEVEGTSELKDIGVMAANLLAGRPVAALPGIIGTLAPATLSALGAGYVANTRQFRRLGRRCFTDKMPGNVLHIGLIHLILPNARIIFPARSDRVRLHLRSRRHRPLLPRLRRSDGAFRQRAPRPRVSSALRGPGCRSRSPGPRIAGSLRISVRAGVPALLGNRPCGANP